MITFSKLDVVPPVMPQSNAFVISIIVANHEFKRVYMDNGATVNILFIKCFQKLGLKKVNAFSNDINKSPRSFIDIGNKVTVFKLSDSNEKMAEQAHQEVAAKRRSSLIIQISVRMVELAVISLLKCSRVLPEWSRKILLIPLLDDSSEKDSSTLILIDPRVGGNQEMFIAGRCR